MKTKIFCVLFTIIIISILWIKSPLRADRNIPLVDVTVPQKSDIYDSVIASGNIKEGKIKTIRLSHTAKIGEVMVSVGDRVKAGDIILEATQTEAAVDNIQSVMNLLPDPSSIESIEDFYIPQDVIKITEETQNILSPIDGVVTKVDVKKDDVALGQFPIITVSDFDELFVQASVSELYIKNIAVGQNAQITGEAFGGKTYLATVSEISPVAKQKFSLTGSGETTVDVLLKINSKNTSLRPGYTVNVKIVTDRHKNALTLPYSCVIQEGNREFVYVVKNNAAYKKAVRCGFELEDKIEICSGITSKDKVILNPTKEIFHKTAVKIKES